MNINSVSMNSLYSLMSQSRTSKYQIPQSDGTSSGGNLNYEKVREIMDWNSTVKTLTERNRSLYKSSFGLLGVGKFGNQSFKLDASSLNPSVASIKSTSNATEGSFNLTVSQLAQSKEVKGSSFADTSSALNINGDFSLNGHIFSVTSSMSLNDIRDLINNQNIDVTASIDTNNQLTLTSKITGSISNLTASDIQYATQNVLHSSDESIATLTSVSDPTKEFSKTLEVTKTSSTSMEGALDFDGKSTWVDLGDLGNLVGGKNSMTYEARIFVDYPFTETILSQHSDDGKNTFVHGIYGSSTDAINVEGSSTVYLDSDYYSTEKRTQWVDLSVVVNGNTVTTYHDGVKISEKTISDRTNYTAGQKFQLGMDYDPSGTGAVMSDFFQGKMSNVRLYNRALTDSEINSGTQNGIVAEYDFSEGTGTTLTDISGNGNHGTIHGNIMWQKEEDATLTEYKVDGEYFTTSSNIVTLKDTDGNDLATVQLENKVGATTISNTLQVPSVTTSSNETVASVSSVSDSSVAFEKTVEVTKTKTAGTLNFDGSSTYVELNTLGNIGMDDKEITIETRVMRDTIKNQSILTRSRSDGYNSIQTGEWDGNYITNSGTIGLGDNGDSMGTDEWVELSYVFKGQKAMIYENGVKIFEGELTSRDMYDNNQTYFIGMDPDSDGSGGWTPSDFFSGKMDHMRIYDRALSDSEINSGTTTNLQAEYDFNDGSGTTLTDISGNGHHGTINGAVSWDIEDNTIDYKVDGVSYTTTSDNVSLKDSNGNNLATIDLNSIGTTVIKNDPENGVLEDLGVINQYGSFTNITQAGQDALYSIDGGAVNTSSSNNISHNEIDLTLNGIGTTTISLSKDSSSSTDGFNDIVEFFGDLNSMKLFLNRSDTYMKDDLSNQIDRFMSTKHSTLVSFGITRDREGIYTIDELMLKNALSTNLEQVESVFNTGYNSINSFFSSLSLDVSENLYSYVQSPPSNDTSSLNSYY